MALTTTSRQQLTGESSHLGITFFNDLQCCPQAIHPNHLPNCCNNPTRKKQLKNNSAKNKTPSAKTPSTLDPQPVGSGGMRFFRKRQNHQLPPRLGRGSSVGVCVLARSTRELFVVSLTTTAFSDRKMLGSYGGKFSIFVGRTCCENPPVMKGALAIFWIQLYN